MEWGIRMPDRAAPPVFVIEMKECPIRPSPSRVRITSPWLDLARLATGRLRREERCHVFVPESRFREDPNAHARFKKSMTVVAEDPSPRKLLSMVDDLRRCACDYVFGPETMGGGASTGGGAGHGGGASTHGTAGTHGIAGTGDTIAIMAASLDVPVRLAFSEAWPEEVLEGLLDYFLGSPTLTAPIEPFYSLAGAIGRGRQVTLWQLFNEVLGRDYFVDADGRVSLAARWAERGMFFGTAGAGVNGFKDSELWAEIEGLKKKLFTSQAPCAFCEHYPYCGGFWSATGRAAQTCATWRRLMDRLVAAYRQEKGGDRKGRGDA